jgi:hypothetical protein
VISESASEPRTWQLSITRDDRTNKWTVQNPAGKVHRGYKPERDHGADREADKIEWTLDTSENVSAHFQFTQPDLFVGVEGEGKITRDLVAVIPSPGGKLKLQLKKDADRRKNPRYYAVWIRDETHPDGGEYAVGEAGNPPPEMQVGP